jgi:hypothetical protein
MPEKRSPITFPSRALAVRQPWSHCIIYHGKTIENRDWPTRWTGRLAIHASKSRQYLLEDIDAIKQEHGIIIDPAELVFGAVIGSVDMVGCVNTSPSKWFQGKYGFVLKNPFAYPEPIFTNGKLNLYNTDHIAAALALFETLR